ncbi:hypothetical protein P261_00226 [Lachnospiraceae bacterium TWA4]|nr:hypothetical protein P261_00226 [Lachnospiraceae bacterium TWA4]
MIEPIEGKSILETKKIIAQRLVGTKGHPLETLTRENEQLLKVIEGLVEQLENGEDINLTKLRQISIHYAKKGDLLYPLLKVKYEIAGPSDLMWTEDDEIRDEIIRLDKKDVHDNEWLSRVKDVLAKAKQMITKEERIFFPMCAINFTEDEWKEIYFDAKDYSTCFDVEENLWEEAGQKVSKTVESIDDEIVLPGGHLTLAQLTALLDTIPMEITFVDDQNINRFFNDYGQPKLFKRPDMAIDREVFSCHPPKIEPVVRKIIEDFRTSKKDLVPIWMNKGGKTVLVTYMAVRDKQGNYLGTVELVQDMEFAKKHFEK